jgi:hypothetical protein
MAWANLLLIIQIMKVARQSPMHLPDVVCKCAINYPHHEGAQFMAKGFHEENSMAPLIS